MSGLTGHPANDRLSALRSIFRALKQERLVFRDPTRGATLAAIVRLPASIPTNRLCGLIERASGPLAKLVVALIAIHGLGKREVTEPLLADLDRARGKLVVHRPADVTSSISTNSPRRPGASALELPPREIDRHRHEVTQMQHLRTGNPS